jgi:hypothetical protein
MLTIASVCSLPIPNIDCGIPIPSASVGLLIATSLFILAWAFSVDIP